MEILREGKEVCFNVGEEIRMRGFHSVDLNQTSENVIINTSTLFALEKIAKKGIKAPTIIVKMPKYI